MRKKPSRLADTVRMRAWRDRKGGTKPAAPPAAPTVLGHWLAKWRESMKERGNAPATVVSQTDHAWHFIRWCHAREVRDPSCDALFLTGYGDGFSAGAVGHLVRRYLDAIGMHCRGGTHLLRSFLENPAPAGHPPARQFDKCRYAERRLGAAPTRGATAG